MSDDKDDEPKWWVTMIKLVVGAAIFIGLIAGALIYAGKVEQATIKPAAGPDWGIAGDSPIRYKR